MCVCVCVYKLYATMVSSKEKHHQNDQLLRVSARLGSRPNGLVQALGSPEKTGGLKGQPADEPENYLAVP